MGYSSYPRSAVLVLGQSSVYSLLPSTFFAQAESLLQNGRLAEVEALLERTEADLAQGSTTSGYQVGGVRYSDLYALTRYAPKETLRYLHQCLAFAFVRQTRFREATAHFVKGAIDPRVPVSYFDELRPALFSESPNHEKDGDTSLRSIEGDCVEVEVWDGVREYMPDETSVDDISKSISIFLILPLPLRRRPTSSHVSSLFQLPTAHRPTGNSTYPLPLLPMTSHASHNYRPCPTICDK